MRYFSLVVIFFAVVFQLSAMPNLQIDTSKYVLLDYSKNLRVSEFPYSSKATTLSLKEIEQIELIIKKAAAKYNKQQIEFTNSRSDDKKVRNWLYNPIKNPESYFKQFIAVIAPNGHKLVWINCIKDKEFLLKQGTDLRKAPCIVMDGGSNYFNLQIDITNGTVIFFRVNGNA